MNALDLLNDRITVNAINGKQEAVAALREVREAIQALPATGDDKARKRIEQLEHALALQMHHGSLWQELQADTAAERDSALAEVAHLRATTVPACIRLDGHGRWTVFAVNRYGDRYSLARGDGGETSAREWIVSQHAKAKEAQSTHCPHCGDQLLWSESRGAHCDGCDEYDEEAQGVKRTHAEPNPYKKGGDDENECNPQVV